MLSVETLSESDLEFILSDSIAKSMAAIGIEMIDGEYYRQGIKMTREQAEDLADYYYVTGEEPTNYEAVQEYPKEYLL